MWICLLYLSRRSEKAPFLSRPTIAGKPKYFSGLFLLTTPRMWHISIIFSSITIEFKNTANLLKLINFPKHYAYLPNKLLKLATLEELSSPKIKLSQNICVISGVPLAILAPINHPLRDANLRRNGNPSLQIKNKNELKGSPCRNPREDKKLYIF